MRRTTFFGGAAAAFFASSLAFSCTPDPQGPASGAPDFDKRRDVPAHNDAPPTTTAPTAPAPRLGCIGVEAPLAITSGLPYAKVRVGSTPSFEGSFLLDFATNGSTIDLSKFPKPGPTASKCDPSKIGQLCSFADLDVFGSWGEVSLLTSKHGGLQAGILGTDFMSLVAITIDYGKSVVHHATKKDFCADGDLALAGFSPLSSAGFFTNDVTKLRPLTDVIAGAQSSVAVANVPTVPLRIAGVTTFAQLDTGFDDALVPYSINVNEALLADVSGKAPGALVRAADKDLFLSTCAGVSEHVEAYTLAPGAAVDLVGELGQAVKSFASAVLFVKHTPPAARKCGGIGTWTVPAAQVGASFYVALGVVIFDPFGSRVWVK